MMIRYAIISQEENHSKNVQNISKSIRIINKIELKEMGKMAIILFKKIILRKL